MLTHNFDNPPSVLLLKLAGSEGVSQNDPCIIPHRSPVISLQSPFISWVSKGPVFEKLPLD